MLTMALKRIHEERRIGAQTPVRPITPALEQHYTVTEIAAMWGFCENKIREFFRFEPGVLHGTVRKPGSRRRQYDHLRIPESVMLRVHARMGPRDQ
jgi:hypothetical protein